MSIRTPRRQRLLAIARLLPLALVSLLFSACQSAGPQSIFEPVGRLAKEQLDLTYLVFWVAVFVFVVVEGALLYIIIKFRRKPTDTQLPPQTHGNTRLEVAWTIAPILLLVVVAVPTYRMIAAHDRPPADAKVLHVDVVANQWWWEFRYPELGIVTANELHFPINTPVEVNLLSNDVIHSFWIPKLAGKTDVVPGQPRPNHMWFESPEPGNFYGQCAEFCGLAHAQMRFRAIAQTQADFDRWVAEQKAPPVAPSDDLALQGQTLFAAKGCVVCHTINGTKDESALQTARNKGYTDAVRAGQQPGSFPGPNLTTFGTRGTMAAGLVDRNKENLTKWINNPGDIKPGNRMSEIAAAYQPGSRLTPQEVDALVAYLLDRKTDPTAALATPAPAASPTPGGAPAADIPGGQVKLDIGAVGNNLAFTKTSLKVRAGSSVTLTFKNESPVFDHNWVLIKQGTDAAVGEAGVTAGANQNYVPPGNPNVLSNTKLAKPGQSSVAEFAAPAPGMYTYVCTVQGHWAIMKGTFEVVP